MKSFDRLREQSLEEKLKSSDPAGKWVSDFVHSDNPKFAGKSKTERIRMALGASYAAKRNEEIELGEAVHRIGLTVTDPNHPMVSKRKETIQKTVRVTSDDREKAIKSAIAHHKRKGYKVHDHHYIGTVNEAKDAREYDYEGDMAKSQLRAIIANAQQVHDMLEDTTNMAEWVQSKITLAADYITDDPARLPEVPVALVLGAAPIGPEGGPNRYFVYRLDAAAALYKAGKVKYLLVSGDNSRALAPNRRTRRVKANEACGLFQPYGPPCGLMAPSARAGRRQFQH